MNIIGNVCEILDIFFENMNRHLKILEYKFDSQSQDYRDISHENKIENKKDKPNKVTEPRSYWSWNGHCCYQFISFCYVGWKSMYPKMESGSAFKL